MYIMCPAQTGHIPSLHLKKLLTMSPKSPLAVFSELFSGIPIKLQEQTHNIDKMYIATFEAR